MHENQCLTLFYYETTTHPNFKIVVTWIDHMMAVKDKL